MPIPQEHRGRCFYHFTHIDNIESIVKYGLLSTNEKKKRGIRHVNLAAEEIQARRSVMEVNRYPYGTIHDYVPFYFASRTPMLLNVINRKNVDQQLIVYIAVSIDKLLKDNVIFTDASANATERPNFYRDPRNLNSLNWILIDSSGWGYDDRERRERMAEVLVYKRVPLDWIENYIVYNSFCKEKIIEIYKKYGLEKPKILYTKKNGRFFYYTKFFLQGRQNETLVTGPISLSELYVDVIKEIKDKRKKIKKEKCIFLNIDDALKKIIEDFCIIKELEDIYELETENEVHNETVSDHTIMVVENLSKNEYYNKLSTIDKKIVKLSAYLHDIGKGPVSKWKNGIQPVYPDHPADSLRMTKRILSEDFKNLSEYEIEKICLLVAYHDLIGDILMKGRDEQQLLDLQITENDLDMLIALTLADVSAINEEWERRIRCILPEWEARIRRELSRK